MSPPASDPSARLEDRLLAPPGRDVEDLLAAYRSGEVPRISADLRAACRVARARPDTFRNSGPVLALSVGGSNSAAMLCENTGDRLVVHAAVRRPNPAATRPWREFVGELLAERPALLAYLRTAARPRVGVTLAVPFVEGVPRHPSKMPTLEGLVARSSSDTRASHHAPTNIAALLASLGARPPLVVCEGDAPTAHLGGLAACRVENTAPSLLFVCGTGMACADDCEFILPGMHRMLQARDPELYPADETEDGQFQYLCAGKGVYRILRRALVLAASRPNSPLAAAPPPDWLREAADTRLVYQIWQYTLPGRAGTPPPPRLAAIRSSYAPAAWRAVESLATAIAREAVRAMSAAILATLAVRSDCAMRPVTVFVEGGIARDRDIFAALEAALEADHARLLQAAPTACPERIVWRLEPDTPAEGAADDVACVDLTLRGAAALAMTADGV